MAHAQNNGLCKRFYFKFEETEGAKNFIGVYTYVAPSGQENIICTQSEGDVTNCPSPSERRMLREGMDLMETFWRPRDRMSGFKIRTVLIPRSEPVVQRQEPVVQPLIVPKKEQNSIACSVLFTARLPMTTSKERSSQLIMTMRANSSDECETVGQC